MTKPIEIKEHGNYIYGTLDGVDFVTSGIIAETKQPYGASVKLKFIMKAYKSKEVNGVEIKTKVANSQILKINCQDDELATLVNKYNELDGKDLLVNYGGKDGDTFIIHDEKDILTIK